MAVTSGSYTVGGSFISPIAATAESYYVPDDRAPGHTIDGSGMTPNTPVPSSICSTAPAGKMWLSNNKVQTWITYDLGSTQTFIGFYVWNYNEAGVYSGRGVKTAGIYYGTSLLANGSSYASAGATWGTLEENMTFIQASGTSSCTSTRYTFATPITSRYIQIYVTANFGTSDNYTGLSEILFILQGSGDYGNWAEAMVSCNGQTLTGNLTFTQISNVTETAGTSWAGSNFGGYKLKLTSTVHNGDPTQGYLTTLSFISSANWIYFNAPGGAGSVEISNLKFTYTTTAIALIKDLNTASASYWIHDILITNGNGYGGLIDSSSAASTVFNNIAAYNISYILVNSSASDNVTFINLTIYTCTTGFPNIASGTYNLYNCAVFMAGTCYGTGYSVFQKCASQDASGSEASLRSLTAANCFASLTNTDKNFLDVKINGPLWKTGYAILASGQTKDIRGRPLPTNIGTKYTIGVAGSWPQQVIVATVALPFPQGWSRRCIMTINHTKIPTSDQSDFPVALIWNGSTGNLPEEVYNNSASSPLSSGADIRFSSDIGGTNQLAFEIVTFTPNSTIASARVEIYVKLPTVTTAADTTFYMWWNNPTAVASGVIYGSQAVWSNNYLAVWHFNNTPVLTQAGILDSVGIHHGTPYGTVDVDNMHLVAGKLGSALYFNGTDNYVSMASPSTIVIGQAHFSIYGLAASSSDTRGRTLFNKTTTNTHVAGDKDITWNYTTLAKWQADSAGVWALEDDSTITNDGVYYSISWRQQYKYDGSKDQWWVSHDGGTEYTKNGLTTSADIVGALVQVGREMTGYTTFWEGGVDEIRFASSYRDANWVIAEHNATYGFATFVTPGTPQ